MPPLPVADGLAWGPGCFDMKAGIVQAFHALASLDSLDGVVVLLNEHPSDEQTEGARQAAAACPAQVINLEE